MSVPRVFAAFLFAAALITPVSSRADQLLDVAPLPEGVLPLPDPSVGTKIGLVIDSKNAPNYKKVITPEIYQLIRSGQLFIDAAARLKYVWRRHDDWEHRSHELAAEPTKLAESGLPTGQLRLDAGFPFGSGQKLLADWESQKQRNNRQTGYQLLWNLAASFWGLNFIESNFHLDWLDERSVFRSAQGKLLRAYPTRIETADKSEQLFRERLEFTSPSVLDQYRLLSYRFRGADEDMMWLHSPVNQKVRQLTGSNRSDSLVTSSVSADDFLCWSGNISAVNANLQGWSVQLAPFPRVDLTPLNVAPEGCSSIVLGQDTRSFDAFRSAWNFDSKRFPGAAGWVPTRVVFVPRRLWKIELASKDPYSLYGRQVLYVDVAMQLPVFKIVYDRAGTHWKTVMCSFGLAANQERSVKLPYLAYSVVLDHVDKKAFTLQYSDVRYCPNYPEGLDKNYFTPTQLVSAPQ